MTRLRSCLLAAIALLPASPLPIVAAEAAAPPTRPNFLFIITDDHAVQALGSGEADSPVPLPGFRRLAGEGMVFDRAYCANSLCGPSRACMLTGRHSHRNGFTHNYGGPSFDGAQPTYPKMLQAAGYQTGIIGKWHLHSNPTGFDSWEIFPGQGDYWNPTFLSPGENGRAVSHREAGYVTDILTQKAMKWIDARDKSKPFALILGQKAPHRNWIPAVRHLKPIREAVARMTPPATLDDDWSGRPGFFTHNRQSVLHDLCNWNDSHLVESLIPFDVMKEIVPKGQLRSMVERGRFAGEIPADFDLATHQPRFAPKTNYGWNLSGAPAGPREAYMEFFGERTKAFVEDFRAGKVQTPEDMARYRWRWYMEDYLGTLLAVDESLHTLMDYLDANGLSENTLVIYVGDQGFYLGEHGLYDKRLIFEESFRMPLIMRWKGTIAPGTRSQAMVQNIDYAPTLVELAGAATPENLRSFQGRSLAPLLPTGDAPAFRDRPLYYAFYEQPGEHNAPRHDGLRTARYTIARIATPTPAERQASRREPGNEWLLIDNEADPQQLHNLATDPAYAETLQRLQKLYHEQRAHYQVPQDSPGDGRSIPVFKPAWGQE